MSPSKAKRHRRRRQLHHQSHHPSNPKQHKKQLDEEATATANNVVTQPIFFAVSNSDDELLVSRVMPEVLSGHMDDTSWNSFCDKLDEAVQPLTKMRKKMKKWCFYPLALFIPLIVIGLVTTAIVAVASRSSSSSSSTSSTMGTMNQLLPLLFLIAFLLSIPWAIYMSNYSSRCKKKVNECLEKVCCDTAKAACGDGEGESGVSFKAFIEMRYIQVLVTKSDNNNNNTSYDLEKGNVVSYNDDKTETDYDDPAADDTFDTYSICSDANTAKSSVYSITPEEFLEAKKWKTAIDEHTNKMYYFNEETKEVTWEHPLGFDVEENNATDGSSGSRGNNNYRGGSGHGSPDGKTFIDSHGKELEVSSDASAAGMDVGVETSILFRQVSWEIPREEDEVVTQTTTTGTTEENNDTNGKKKKKIGKAKKKFVYGEPAIDG